MARGRIHREQRNHLQQMVLHHVADGADLLVEGAAALHAELFGHGDLHIADVVAVPNRFEKGIGEAKIQDVLHRFLAQIMVDPKNEGFRKYFMQSAVQRLRGREIAPERFFDDDPRLLGAAGFGETLHDRAEHARRNRQVVNRPGCGAQSLFQPGEGRRIGVVAAHIAQLRRQLLEATGFEVAAALLDALAGALFQLVQGPARARHADNGNVEAVAVNHGIERRKDFLVCQIAGGAEKNEGVGVDFTSVRVAFTSVRVHLTPRLQFAPQVFQFFHQVECERDAGKIDFKIPLEPQGEARAPQGGAGKAPFGCFDFNDADHSFVDEFHDVPFIDGADAAQILNGENCRFLEDRAGQGLFFR